MGIGLILAFALAAGAGRVKITPPAGTPMAGYYYDRGSTGVHDDLWVRALVLEAGGERAALVACDVIHLTRPVVEEARRLILAETGLAPGQVMVSATHAHTGPEMKGDYARWLPPRIAESVKIAAASMKPVRLAAGWGNETSLPFNRRYFMTDGSVGWNPGKKNPRIVRPAGPVDLKVGVVSFDPVAAYVNFAMHLDTVGGTDVSADYPYTLEKLLEGALGGGVMAMFTIGCAGNVNHIDVSDARPQKGHEEAARIGTVLAGEALKTYARMTKLEPAALRSASETVLLPLAKHDPSEVEWAREVRAKYGKPNAAPFLDLVKAFRITDVEGRQGKPLEAEVQVIALGRDVAWVGLPGEIFVELGLAIQRASPFPHTIVVELANGNVGYVPDSKAWPEGNYEVISARCAQGSGEKLAETAGRMLKEMFTWK